MQGFNMGRYYPPSDSAPTFNQGSHPLGARAKHISSGILTVRFELPFAVWCTTCKPEAIVGQGVRFNAQKSRVGSFHSTPIWAFRMKHSACGGWWEIRTDPENAKYVVVSGARKRDYGEDEKGEGEMAFLSEKEREKRREDAFAGFEGRVDEKGSEKRGKERVAELLEASEAWRDVYTANAKLRRGFRAQRKVLEKEEAAKEDMRERFGLGIEIQDEQAIDGVRAGMVEFGMKGTGGEVMRRGMFEQKEEERDADVIVRPGRRKAEMLAEKRREDLRKSLVGNTKAAIDPFLVADQTREKAKVNLRILKRKRTEELEEDSATIPAAIEQGLPGDLPARQVENAPIQKAASLPLVDYDSD